MAASATVKRKPRPKRQRVKKGFLPGMEPVSNKKIDAAAENYYETMMERTQLSKEEDEKKTALIESMREAGLERYETPDGLVITLTAKSNVKAKKKKDADSKSSNGDGVKGEG
jgi:hypothetical protein